MKIDRSKSKKGSSDVPFDCKILIEELKSCDEEQLLLVLKRIKTWNCGKCELYHWIDVLDIFDSILEECCRKESPEQWILPVDMPQNAKKRELLLAVISFTSLLIEHSFSRHLYNSIEHLITLLSSTDMQIVLAILNLLFVFSKRSNFFSRINTDKRQSLLSLLYYLAENWGGKDQGFGLAQCCQDLPLSSYPSNATTFNFEFYSNIPTTTNLGSTNAGFGESSSASKIKLKENQSKKTNIVKINIENVSMIDKPVSQIMAEIVETYKIPCEQQMQIFTQLRLTKNFANYSTRLQCVQARLNALSIMVYCQAMSAQDNYHQLLYTGLIEELVEVLELKIPELIEIKSASLKTLTSIIHLDRNSKLKVIIDSTGANSYHGFLPILVRNCIKSLISANMDEYPLNFVTALFSFLYHLASNETGCEALVQCGIMESLLRVVDWKGSELDHITFVTRAVRVIDLLTNQSIDVNAFQSNNGLNTFVQRLEYEVDICRTEQPYEIEVPADKINKDKNSLIDEDLIDTETTLKKDEGRLETPMEVEIEPDPVTWHSNPSTSNKQSSNQQNSLQCNPQRAALLKSMLNFLKKAVQCSGFSESVRPLMYGNFPRSLRHIISNAEYYGSSLFLLATDVVSVYVYQEPSLLSVVQDNGLTDVVLHALLVKDVPPTKEVLASLPTVFTSLCLNHRGLQAFVALNPFERLFKIFLSPDYLQAMRRRRSESIGDTATCLGNAMDELMRHQVSLRSDAIGAIIKLLEEICNLGSDPKYICTKASSKNSEPTPSLMTFNENTDRNLPASNVNDSSSSGEDDDYDDDTATTAEASNVPANNGMIIPSTDDSNVSKLNTNRTEQNRQQIPLIDYILNVMRFVDAILSNNSTDDHCREFLRQNGLEPLFKLLKLPNLPLDFPVMPACYSIAGVFKSLLNLAHEKDIFTKGLENLKEILEKLDPLSQSAKTFNGSILLEDLINHISSKKTTSINFVTPVLQSMAAAHSYIIMFIHICRTSQGDIRSLSIEHWGSNLGIEIINLLSSLYIALVWESTLLLGLNDSTSLKYEFIRTQIEKLSSLLKNNADIDNALSPMEVDFDIEPSSTNYGVRSELPEKKNKSSNSSKPAHQKYIKPLLTVASRLGRALAELFGLLVKLCVGSPVRRRSHHAYFPSNAQSITPSKPAQNIAKHLNILLFNGLSWKPSFDTNIPKFRLTFYVCSIGFSSPMLFDDRKYPYHIMLRNFVLNGGLDAFFECFQVAFDPNQLSNNELPDGIIEFLDSWLSLLEKLTNPQTLLDSPHAYSAPKSHELNHEDINFDPIHYLIRTHDKAFPCVMQLWNSKLYKIKFDRAIVSLLTILSHIIKGEMIIEKHLCKSQQTAVAGPAASSGGDASSELSINLAGSSSLRVENNPNVQTLIEMGFSRDLAIDALLNVGDDVIAATEWILSHNPRYFDSEEEQMIQAIALSLSESREESNLKSNEEKDKNVTAETSKEKKKPQTNEIALNKEPINLFTSNVLVGIFRLIDHHPSLVHKCCEMLIAISKRNGKKWFEELLGQLIEDIIVNIMDLNNHTSYIRDSKTPNNWANQLSTLPEAVKLVSRIHLLVLLFNESKNVCARQISQSLLLNHLIELLENASYLLNVVYEKEATITTPKWIAPIIVLIDLYEKNALASRRRKRLLLDFPKRTWKYLEERSARWLAYQPENVKIIDEAFRNGEQYCRVYVSRRRYIINLSTLTQFNDESGNRRPVMFFMEPEKQDKNDKQNSNSKSSENKGNSSNSSPESIIKDEKTKKLKEKGVKEKSTDDEFLKDLVEVDFLDQKQCKTIIDSMVNLIQLPIDSEALNAVIRLVLRLSQNYENACSFVEKNGISGLLKIPHSSVFPGFISLTTLIIRHILEDQQTLKFTMDKMIRLEANVPHLPRDVHCVFRHLAPAACRDSEAFKNSAMNVLRMNIPFSVNTPRRATLEEDRSTNLLRTVNLKPNELPNEISLEIPKITKDIICELLNMLPLKHAQRIKNLDLSEVNKTSEDAKKDQDVFYTHTILSILAELTTAYHIVAKVICEHTYSIDSILEDCSAISFILDNLLSYTPNKYGDKECATYSRAILAAIASVPFLTEIHQILVVEIKNALYRAVLLPESVEKHAKIQALSAIVTIIVEAHCPTPQSFYRTQLVTSSNPMFKLLIRKNLITDLAKVIQFLDLSTPMMAATVNSLLKTLEFLSKAMNTPQNPFNSRNQQSQQQNRNRIEISNNFPIPIIDLDPTPSGENADAIMEHDHSENLTNNSGNNQDSSQINQTASQNTNAINEEINASTISNTLDNSNVDENTENELFLDSVAYEYNSHPRSGTFTSDDLRTDDDEDDEQNPMGDPVNDHNELHENVANSNCVESTSSDDTESDESEDDSDDGELEEEEEEEEDGVGSTQDEHEEDEEEDDDEDDHMEDEEELEADDLALHAVFDDRYQDATDFIFNLEEMLPRFLHVRDRSIPPAPYFLSWSQDDSAIHLHGHGHSSSIDPHHPLLNNSSDNLTTNASVNNSTVSNNSNIPNHLAAGSRVPRNPRHRFLRSYFQGNHNWHVAHLNSRSNPSQILQRLLGSASPHAEIFPALRSSHLLPTRQEIDLRDEFYDLTVPSVNPLNPFQSSSLAIIPSTMDRWIEESRILYGECINDAELLVKTEIIKHLEKLKEEEMQEKKKKEKEDMETSKDNKKPSNNADSATNNSNSNSSAVEPHIDEIQAHIEQLTNSVINQVLESNPSGHPSGQIISQNTSTSNPSQASSAEVNVSDPNSSSNAINRGVINDPINNELDLSRIELVPVERLIVDEVPMSITENTASSDANDDAVVIDEASSGENIEQSVELMDHSSSQVSTEQQPPVDATASQSTSNTTMNSCAVSTEQQDSASTSNIPSISRPIYQMTAEERAILGDQELPEGVDPSFLAALPENIRQEVIAEQFRLQRLNYLRSQTAGSTASPAANASSSNTVPGNVSNSFAEVNPEFLAALPPNIQEEVLAQQRAEQQRLNAQNTNPDTPVDPESFFRSLPASLRRQVLSDLDDSQAQLLPPEFANEARALRREFEMRNRQLHDRLFSSNTAISHLIRSATSARGRTYDTLHIPNWTFARFSLRGGGQDNRDSYGNLTRYLPRAFTSRSVKGKYLLDYDALSSILILLFIHDNLISSMRLHRVIKNLCYHPPTRQWIIQSLLEIMEKTKESNDQSSSHSNTYGIEDQAFKNLTQNHFVSWLSITLDSSFGSKTNVFYINKSNNPTSSSSTKKCSSIYAISINPQASLFVCRNVLDILILLAKTFPDQFITFTNVPLLQKNLSATSLNTSSSSIKDPNESTTGSLSLSQSKPAPSFFDVLMRHDFIHINKKTKSKVPSSSNLSQSSDVDSSKTIDYSPFSQLLNLLSHHFIKKSPMLTDRLMRLMTQITSALTPDSDNRNQTPINLSNEIKEKLNEIEKTIANERLLKLVVDVLVSKSCSEEGLADATALLMKLSNLFPNCRNIFYKLLLDGVRLLGETVYHDINTLSVEMKELLLKLKQEKSSNDNEPMEKNIKGQSNVNDRYSNMVIVINAQSNVKHNISGKEVQLPSMSNLISKSSSQFLFLRVLRIIMHIREINAKNAAKPQQTENQNSSETKMDVDKDEETKLSAELQLDHLWEKLSDCLSLLSEAPDDHVVLVLQPAVESFFLVHAPGKAKTGAKIEQVTVQLAHINQSGESSINAETNSDIENRQYNSLPADTQKFLIFAEKHRVVLNQILRQSNVHLANGPFSVLVDHTRILDFDVKRRYFRQELERLDHGVRRDDLPLHIRREHVFEDSYRELNRRSPDDWKNRLYIVFEGEEGQDAGGLLREWYTIISREIFNPNYALFTTSPGDRVTYMINSASHCNSNHLSYFKFVGRVISKAIHDNKLLDCYFTRSFYKHILGKLVKYTDMESEDYAFYQGLVFLLEHNVNELGTELSFSLEIQEFGVTEVRDLIPNGRNIIVTEENKHEYVKLVCQEKMTGSIKKQLNSFLEGFYEIIPKRLISIFNEHELELLISGLPNIDIDDLKANTDYHKYQATSLQIQWFWRALRTFDQADRAKFLQFVTGTSKVPLQGFSALEGMNGPQKFQIHLDDRSTDRLPSAHTCFNQLDLPAYETYDKLRLMLLKAIHECSEGFGFA